jgi:chemosensory pili system protein ChpA (sensor histidine kinase/response regulator)
VVQSAGVKSQDNKGQSKKPLDDFHKKVLLHLGEMLKILKKGDSSETRIQMQSHCQHLFDLGKPMKLRGWLELTATAKEAIANPKTPYDGITKLVIKEFKQALELVLANQQSQIRVAQSLQGCAHLSLSRLGEIEQICREDQPKIGESVDTLSRDLWASQITISKETVERQKEELKHSPEDNAPNLTPSESTPTQDISQEDIESIFDRDFPGNVEVSSEQPGQTVDENFLEDLFAEKEDEVSQLSPQRELDDLEDLENLFEEQEQQINLEHTTSGEQTLDDIQEIGMLFENLNLATDKTGETQRRSQKTRTELEFFNDFDEEEEKEIDLESPENERKYLTTSGKTKDFETGFEGELNEEEKLNLDIFEQEAEAEEFNVLEDLEDFSIILKNSKQEPKESREQESLEEFLDAQLEGFGENEEGENLEANTAVLARSSMEEEESLALLREELVLYRQLEDLEPLIYSPTMADEKMSLSFAQLEAVIDSFPQMSIGEITEESEEELEENSIFEDLEGLLGQGETSKTGQQANKAAPSLNPPPGGGAKFEQTMRVPIKQLDSLNNLIGEVVVKRNRLEENQERLRSFLDNLLSHVQNLGELGSKMQDLYERSLLEGALLSSRTPPHPGEGISVYNGSPSKPHESHKGFGALEIDQFSDFHLIAQEMMESIIRIKEASSDIEFMIDETEQLGQTMRQVATQLQENMNKSRMVPFSHLLDAMGLVRAVRRVADELQKQVELKIEGREVLIDKMLLENLKAPMTHLVNNSISHGIETPEVRKVKGKSPVGKLTVRAFLQANQTVITVSDDGAGINPEKVKNKAVERGLITKSQAKAMSNPEVYDLLFSPGFSTKDRADQFAGRGVGLDVVRTNLNTVRGSASVDSSLGKGTSFVLRLPLTMSICKALPCLSNNAKIAFPMDTVEDIFQDYPKEELELSEDGRYFVKWHDSTLEVFPLARLLTYNRQQNRVVYGGSRKKEDTVCIVVLGGAGEHLAIEVDQVLKEEEIVIKQIEGPIPKPFGIAGATVLGDGTVMPIGDVLELVKLAQQGISKTVDLIPEIPEEQVHSQPTVLIIDDSIAVRELLSMSLHRAGYRVEQAKDGQEGWDKLRSGIRCDIIFCDIEMPRMNGLELLSRMQTDEHLANIPLTLLTSRGAEKHRRVAAELGASGYLTKPYTERDLLDAAEKMLRGETWLDKARANESRPEHRTIPDEMEASPTVEKIEKTTDSGGAVKSTPSVLIIDDSVVMREMLSMTFKKAGYKIEQARDGQDALNKLRGGLQCDLMLCDIEMPRMTGLELLSHLQKDEKLAPIPVAMVTSRGTEKHRRTATSLGAKAYFTKPYLENELLDSAKRLMQGENLLLEVSNS